MGWKTYLKLDQSFFKNLYDSAQFWGGLVSYSVTIGGSTIYGAGLFLDTQFSLTPSGRMQHGYAKSRIIIKYYVLNFNGIGKTSIGVAFFKDDTSIKDTAGYDFFGAKHTISTPASTLTGEPHTLTYEQDGTKVSWYVDGNKLDETTLAEQNIASFKIYISIDEITQGEIGIIVYDVEAQYYDVLEDIINQMTGVMNMMMWLMIPMIIIVLITSVIKKPKGE